MSNSVALLPAGEAQLLDRYQLIGEIATGGMATVFLARIAGVAGFQRFVAIKQLHSHLSRRPEFVEMFLDEARLAASLHHQNVVPILEIGTSEGGYYVVMEYVEGVTFTRLMREGGGRVPRRIVLRIIIDVLSGLDAAHELTDNSGMLLGVVHRDCSPQNILVGLDGCSRLTDFGIARASRRLATTRDGSTKGKLAYMAPEQTQAEDVDRRADLFSAGVVLWEGLAQKRLFKRRAEAEALRALLDDPIPPLDSVVPDMPTALVACVARALDRDPNRRFQTASAMADAIEEATRETDQDGIATVRELEAYMREQFGGTFAFQRDEVRSYLAGTPSSRGFGGPVSRSGVHTSAVPMGKPSEPTQLGRITYDEDRTRVFNRTSRPTREPKPSAPTLVPMPDVAPVSVPGSVSSIPSAVASVSTDPISLTGGTDPMSLSGFTDPMSLPDLTDPMSVPSLVTESHDGAGVTDPLASAPPAAASKVEAEVFRTRRSVVPMAIFVAALAFMLVGALRYLSRGDGGQSHPESPSSKSRLEALPDRAESQPPPLAVAGAERTAPAAASAAHSKTTPAPLRRRPAGTVVSGVKVKQPAAAKAAVSESKPEKAAVTVQPDKAPAPVSSAEPAKKPPPAEPAKKPPPVEPAEDDLSNPYR